MDIKEHFNFIGKIESIPRIYRCYGIIVPQEILEKLPQKGRIRTKGTINSTPFNLAIQNDKVYGKYFTISTALLKSTKTKLGQPIAVSFELASLDELEIPEEFLITLEQDEEAEKIFNGFTVGLKRGLMHYVSSAKQIDTRIKRSLELAEKIKMGMLHSQKPKE